jgi:hypothetical protein
MKGKERQRIPILVLGRLRQEVCEFEASLGFEARSCLKKKPKPHTHTHTHTHKHPHLKDKGIIHIEGG